jgi:hypothetical protein
MLRRAASTYLKNKQLLAKRGASEALATFGDADSVQELKAAIVIENDPLTRDQMVADCKTLESRLGRAGNASQ